MEVPSYLFLFHELFEYFFVLRSVLTCVIMFRCISALCFSLFVCILMCYDVFQYLSVCFDKLTHHKYYCWIVVCTAYIILRGTLGQLTKKTIDVAYLIVIYVVLLDLVPELSPACSLIAFSKNV